MMSHPLLITDMLFFFNYIFSYLIFVFLMLNNLIFIFHYKNFEVIKISLSF